MVSGILCQWCGFEENNTNIKQIQRFNTLVFTKLFDIRGPQFSTIKYYMYTI